ncbi:tetratricopeptide repeat protein [Alishewanella sp. HL-SH05]|uniref:tetratricopeptide repeat protein n=1 Tax=Alishewanella sp. HL-SH05 TaxID=3461145 RepID=UPI004042E8B6
MPNDQSIKVSLGWEIYRQAAVLVKMQPLNVFAVKRLLQDYLQLALERPSLLHSSILRVADGLSKEAGFDLPAFLKIWGLENFQPDDFTPYLNKESGKKFGSLAERVILHAVKQAVLRDNKAFVAEVLPLLEKIIRASSDPIWLIFYKAKALMVLEQFEEAYKYTLDVAKQKMGDYWIWELLGDIKDFQQSEQAVFFYGKALSLSASEQYLAKLRLKLAKVFIRERNFAAAKAELQQIEAFANESGQSVSQDCQQLMQQPWYQETLALQSNQDFYTKSAEIAEQQLYSALPSYYGVVADSFALKDKPNKKKYRLLIKVPNKSDPIEAFVSERKIKEQKLNLGDAVIVKGEAATGGKFNVLMLGATQADKAADLVKLFEEQCHVSEAGLGFTTSNIFIDAVLVRRHDVRTDSIVSGKAIRSYDKKKARWGWKAMSIKVMQT